MLYEIAWLLLLAAVCALLLTSLILERKNGTPSAGKRLHPSVRR